MDTVHYINVIGPWGEMHLNISEIEKITHLIEKEEKKLTEFTGRWGQSVYLKPIHVDIVIEWNPRSVERYKAFQLETGEG